MTKQKRHKFYSQRTAQTATEIAIFGAVLMFIMGIMVRQAHNANFAQNQAYRAMRLALTKSYLDSQAGSTARNNASILIVEDRLAPGSEKYGPLSRFPVIISGSGSHTRQFFQPPTWSDTDQSELPRVDLYINGQLFPLTAARYIQLTGLDNQFAAPFNDPINYPGGHPEWDPQCAFRLIENTITHVVNIPQWMGCRKFFRIVPNYIQDKSKNEFCCADIDTIYAPDPSMSCTDALKRRCDVTKNLNADRRFDINRDPTNNPQDDIVPVAIRPEFAWQWYLVKGFDPESSKSLDNGFNGQEARPFSVGNNFGDILRVRLGDEAKNKNAVLDIDMDFKEESILDATYNWDGVIQSVRILDSQAGDLDMTYNAMSTGPRPGLQDDLQMYSYSKNTWLDVREGKLFEHVGSKKQWAISTQKRDRMDIIQRTVQLSNDTNRFCKSDQQHPLHLPTTPWPTVDGAPNPVEVCDDCFSASKVDQTCFDRGSKILYIRSRLKDIGGRRWVTSVPE